MKKVYQRISLLLVFIVTLVTCSACFKIDNGIKTDNANVELTTTPSTITFRFMNEALYLGYLGAQRDFALIVDNGGYNQKNKIQNCGGDIGCSSTLAKLVMNAGIPASHFTGVSGSEKLLIYYITSDEFNKIGSSVDDSWFGVLTAIGKDYDEIEFNDTIKSLSCGYSNSKSSMCNYSKQMSNRGYSDIGNSMILLFDSGNLDKIIGDRNLVVDGIRNGNIDNLAFPHNSNNTTVVNKYYDSIINSLKGKIRVSSATNMHATSTGEEQHIEDLETIEELEALVNGTTGVSDFLLLITSSGFITDKIGANKKYGENNFINNMVGISGSEELSEDENNLLILFNSVSTYVDNCALESNKLKNLLMLGLQIAGGAAVGAGAGALIGSVIPFIGTGVGALIGAIVGAFASIKAEKTLLEKNGITDKNYCKIMDNALEGIQINVPIYNFHIDTAQKNIENYKNGKMDDSILQQYYNQNKECVSQNVIVTVPNGILSFLDENIGKEYMYADVCQKKLVSDVVGGFGGSPSLLLYLDGKKADDLHGRVTTELVVEMMTAWGLQSIGDVYTLALTSTMNEISFAVGSVQKLKNVKYCISTSSKPDCSPSDDVIETENIVLNDTYINAISAEKGIKLNFTDSYKTYSRNAASSVLTDTILGNLSLNTKEDKGTGNKSSYFRNVNDDNNVWTEEVFLYGDEAANSKLNEIKTKVIDAIKTNRNQGMYLVNHYGYTYAICDDGDVIGFDITSAGTIIITYFYDSSDAIEYIFNGNEVSIDYGGYLTYSKMKNQKEISVSSAHSFYVYIEYTIESTNNTAYYTYIV